MAAAHSSITGQYKTPIPEPWCQPHLPNHHSTQLLYIGNGPEFNQCMADICIAENPGEYKVRYMKTFALDQVLAKSKQSPSDLVAKQSLTRKLDVNTMEELLSDVLQKLLSKENFEVMLEHAGDYWVFGRGDKHDPCVDRGGVRNTIIMYAVFAAVLVVIMGDWIAQGCGQGEWSGMDVLVAAARWPVAALAQW